MTDLSAKLDDVDRAEELYDTLLPLMQIGSADQYGDKVKAQAAILKALASQPITAETGEVVVTDAAARWPLVTYDTPVETNPEPLAATRRAQSAVVGDGLPDKGSLRGKVPDKIRREAEELANEIWSDLDDVRNTTKLSDAWGCVAEMCGDDIIRFASRLYALTGKE